MCVGTREQKQAGVHTRARKFLLKNILLNYQNSRGVKNGSVMLRTRAKDPTEELRDQKQKEIDLKTKVTLANSKKKKENKEPQKFAVQKKKKTLKSFKSISRRLLQPPFII